MKQLKLNPDAHYGLTFLTIIQIKVLLYHKLINFCLITMKKL